MADWFEHAWSWLNDPTTSRDTIYAGFYLMTAFLAVLAPYMVYLMLTTKTRTIDKLFTWFVVALFAIVLYSVMVDRTSHQIPVLLKFVWFDLAAAVVVTSCYVLYIIIFGDE